MSDRRADRLAELIKPLRVKPGSKVDLARDFDPATRRTLSRKDGPTCSERVSSCWRTTSRMAAQETYGVLVCLQALDAAGKDGTIRHVMSG